MRMTEENLAYGAALLGVGTLLFLGYRAATHAGDVVEVPATAVQGLPPGVPFDPSIRLAVRVSSVAGRIASGTPLGLAEKGVIVTPVNNPGFAVSFPVSAVTGKVKV